MFVWWSGRRTEATASVAAATIPVVLRLYGTPFSTNVERVRLALAHKGLAVEHVEVPADDRSDVIAVSGQHLVPVLATERDEEVIFDSLVILAWLEDRHPDPPLFPREDPRRTEVRLFLEWFDRVWKLPPNAITAELEQLAPDAIRVEGFARRMRDCLMLFERLLQGRPYLMGDELTAADIAAFPFLKFAAGRDPGDDELFHRVLQEHQRLGSEHQNLRAWLERMETLPRA